MLGISRTTAWCWLSGRARPNLEGWLRIAYVFGLRLCDLVTGRLPTQCSVTRRVERRNFAPRRSARRFIEEVVLQEIEAIRRCRSSCPPSLHEIGRCVGFSPRVIRRHFPDLCYQISKAHIAHCSRTVAERRELLRTQLGNALKLARVSSHRTTRRAIGRNLSKPGVLRSAAARELLGQLELPL